MGDEFMKEKNNDNTLTLKHKVGYGLGDCGGVMTFALMGSTFSMYCTDALGINPSTLALLLLIVQPKTIKTSCSLIKSVN